MPQLPYVEGPDPLYFHKGPNFTSFGQGRAGARVQSKAGPRCDPHAWGRTILNFRVQRDIATTDTVAGVNGALNAIPKAGIFDQVRWEYSAVAGEINGNPPGSDLVFAFPPNYPPYLGWTDGLHGETVIFVELPSLPNIQVASFSYANNGFYFSYLAQVFVEQADYILVRAFMLNRNEGFPSVSQQVLVDSGTIRGKYAIPLPSAVYDGTAIGGTSLTANLLFLNITWAEYKLVAGIP